MRTTLLLILALTATLSTARAQNAMLDIYFIDVEGGHATLYVSPTGETLLVDSGSRGGRDSGRIMDVLAEAGVRQIDHHVLTHYHSDHVGGLLELAAQIPIRHFIDHGQTVEAGEPVLGFYQAYAELYGKARHTMVEPGDKILFAGVDVTIVAAAGQVLTAPLSGPGVPNPSCAGFEERDESRVDAENPQSVGFMMRFGQFRTVNLGDLTWNKEFELMCPSNPIGAVDLYLASHHGIDQSGSEVLVHALRPRVAVMNNGPRKGGTPQTNRIIYSSPGLEDLWQLHWSYSGGLEFNPPGLLIANFEEPAAIATALAPPDPAAAPAPGSAPGRGRGQMPPHSPAHWIKVSAQADGVFTVTNTRNGFSKTYRP